MRAKQYEIFSSVNGHVFDVCFGRDNAILRAKALAQKHSLPVGIAQGDGEPEYFSPVTAKAFNRSVTSKQVDIDEISASDILKALRFSLSMEGLRSLSDQDLFGMEQMLYHWQSLAVYELKSRREGV